MIASNKAKLQNQKDGQTNNISCSVSELNKQTINLSKQNLQDKVKGNYYRDATLPKSYRTVIGIIMKSLKLIGQF